MKYDIIGDIHGYKERLESLLRKLGYKPAGNSYRHLERKVIFVGDYIDRGPDNPGVVNLVRDMVEHDWAIAVMGNHEYNAILFNMPDGHGGYLRPHTAKNVGQHKVTMEQYNGKQDDYNEAIAWFKTLPLFYEEESFGVVQACWDNRSINFLKQETKEGVLSDEQFRLSADNNSDLFEAVDITCKGIETELPKGVYFHDKVGHKRHDIRLKWWENPLGKSFKEMSVVQDIEMHHQDFDKEVDFYSLAEKPVFSGHYWLSGQPELLKPNVCCLDYSVAKDGYLVAYRYDGERVLSSDKLVWV